MRDCHVGIQADDEHVCNAVPAPLKQPLTFQHVTGWETSGASKTNQKQAEVAVAIIQTLIKGNQVGSYIRTHSQFSKV